MLLKYQNIIEKLPYSEPFLFVDQLNHLDENGAEGSYTFKEELDFYRGHFDGNPVTPGVILTECCAQIGLVCIGLYLFSESNILHSDFGLFSSEMEFYLPVYPGETVTVSSKKIYFRFHKLKCEVKMYNAQGKMVCKGTLSGMIKLNRNA
ncbi:3-hydroxyacyl-ACP dehydratase FabZ family protein [Cerina litoralis]|uniref:3-hydroxyacyl-ACP dehydratase FabZ family protein n=1 Tax=Cerina litoralis TaxID=2874477 RepID=UPI00295AF2A8|nr:hydroxymyristoyl-ACP dehydratase [Cerina litoralis]